MLMLRKRLSPASLEPTATNYGLESSCFGRVIFSAPRSDPIVATAALLEAFARHAREFDVIHAHIDWLHLPLLTSLAVPFLTTLHGRLDLPDLRSRRRTRPESA